MSYIRNPRPPSTFIAAAVASLFLKKDSLFYKYLDQAALIIIRPHPSSMKFTHSSALQIQGRCILAVQPRLSVTGAA
jgi:hypothetical protein